MTVRRTRTRPSGTAHNRSIFVAYPWNLYPNRDNYKKAYTDLERPLDVKFVFAEQRIESGTVLEKIVAMIGSTAFGIYDVSTWNANVTLEYGVARGMNADTFIAFDPTKASAEDVPADLRGWDRLQYTDLIELSEKLSTVIVQELGPASRSPDPLEDDRRRMLEVIRASPGQTANKIAEAMGRPLDYVQLLVRRSGDGLRTDGRTKGTKYYRQ